MKKRIAYCTPSLYIPGGVERVLTTKANYLADVLGYDIYIILTDGKDKNPYYALSPKIHVINLDINFEELWHCSFIQKSILYLKKQRIYRKRLKATLLDIKPDITISLLRREINFITSIKDGSKKVGEIHVNKENYRNFEKGETNFIKDIFAKWWIYSLTQKVKKLDKFIVLTQEDKEKWTGISNIAVIPNPLPFIPSKQSEVKAKQAIAVGRYVYQKGFDLLIDAWKIVNVNHPDWHLNIYGKGEYQEFQKMAADKGLGQVITCHPSTSSIYERFQESSIFVLSSRYEGFGMVITEAMSCGIPAVSFACPCGPKDIITEGENGLLAEKENVSQLAEKICYLIENDKERKEMGKKARESSKRFTQDAIMKQWIELFDSLTR